MIEIRKIRLKELKSFVESEYFRSLETVPITPSRAQWYINNSEAHNNDIVIYMGYIDDKLIAFRTIFAGKLNSNGKQIKFGWCSGSWVEPRFRRKGFSQQLLMEAYSDWDKKLILTNYAPAAEKLFLKTGLFKPIYKFTGVRAYLFPKTRKLMTVSDSNLVTKFLASVTDLLISAITSVRIWFYRKQPDDVIRYEIIEFPDEECNSFSKKHNDKHLFARNNSGLETVFNFPWISKTDNSFLKKYPFSSFSDSFEYKTVKMFYKNLFTGYFIFSVRDKHLKTLFFLIDADMGRNAAMFLKEYCIANKIELLTVYNSQVAGQLFAQKFPFLRSKKYGQKIYSSFDIDINGYRIQDGDGDTIFT